MADLRRFYWETSVFNAWLNQEKGRWQICDAILKAAEQGQVRIVTSAIALVEVYGYSLKARQEGRLSVQQLEDAESHARALFRAEYLEVVSVDRFIGERAHLLRRDEVRLLKKPIDAIHLASALMTSVDEMHSYDEKDLLRLLPFSGLRILEPSWTFQMPFA